MTELSVQPRFSRRVQVMVFDSSPFTKVVKGWDGDIGLRIKFQVHRALTSTADTASVQIYNLNPTSRAQLAQRSLAFDMREPIRYMRIEAGYEGQIGTVFHGNVMRCWNERHGADWITTLEGNAFFAQAVLNTVGRSWRSDAGFPVRQVLSDLLATAAGVIGVHFSQAAEAKLAGKQLYEYVATGTAYERAVRLAASYGLIIYLDLAQAFVLPPDSPRDDPQIFVSQSTGLVGTPRIMDRGSQFRSLLDPRIRPGQLIQLRSETLRLSQGSLPDESVPKDPSLGHLLTAWGVEIAGDTHDRPWYTDVDALFYPTVYETAIGQIVRARTQ